MSFHSGFLKRIWVHPQVYPRRGENQTQDQAWELDLGWVQALLADPDVTEWLF